METSDILISLNEFSTSSRLRREDRPEERDFGRKGLFNCHSPWSAIDESEGISRVGGGGDVRSLCTYVSPVEFQGRSEVTGLPKLLFHSRRSLLLCFMRKGRSS